MPASRPRKAKLLERRRPGARSIPEKDEAAFERSNGTDRGAPPPEPDGGTSSVAPKRSTLLSSERGALVAKRPAVLSLLLYNTRAFKIHRAVSFPKARVSLSLMVKDAYKFALPPLIAGAVCLIPGWKLAAAILIFLGLFVFYFFRAPERTIPSDTGGVVSPADGHVVEIVDELFNSVMGHRVTIFLAIWDVHVQRAPVAGRIAHVVYRPGKFYAAFRAAASVENEQ